MLHQKRQRVVGEGGAVPCLAGCADFCRLAQTPDLHTKPKAQSLLDVHCPPAATGCADTPFVEQVRPLWHSALNVHDPPAADSSPQLPQLTELTR